jgi:type IV pilus assembly protein PilB
MEKIMSKWKDLGTLLMEYGLINIDALNEALKLQGETGLRLGEALVKLGKVSMEDIDWVLSKQLDIPYVIVDDINVNIELLGKFPKEFLIENRVLPLYEADDQVSIVIEDPFNKSAIAFIEDSSGRKVSLSTGSGSKIEELLKQTFKKVGLPELIDAIKTTIEKIKETSFYRIDFILAEHSCEINVFGSGILKQLTEIKGHFTDEDIFSAFDDLGIHFLYEESFNNNRRFVAVFPLENRIDIRKMPAIVGGYGLFLPEGNIFSDARVYGLLNVFPLSEPIHGYPYLATKDRQSSFEKFIYVIDAAPAEFRDYYVNTYMPGKCPSCNGSGCHICRDLGYEFKKIEGIYSSDYINQCRREDHHG